jgi:hypothetical protein
LLRQTGWNVAGETAFPSRDNKPKEPMVMTSKTVMSLALAAACLTAIATGAQAQGINQPQVITNGPQVDRGDVAGWSARQNVIESQHYDRLLQSSGGFRAARIRKECGPVTDPGLHAQCVTSFAQFEPYAGRMPMVGSSTPRTRYRGTYGR